MFTFLITFVKCKVARLMKNKILLQANNTRQKENIEKHRLQTISCICIIIWIKCLFKANCISNRDSKIKTNVKENFGFSTRFIFNAVATEQVTELVSQKFKFLQFIINAAISVCLVQMHKFRSVLKINVLIHCERKRDINITFKQIY